MPKHLPFFIIASSASYYAELETEAKTKKLQNITKIDFPLIDGGNFIEDKLEEALEKLNQKSLYFIISDEVFLHHIGDFPLKAPQPLEEQISHTVETAFPDQTESLHIVTLSLAKTSKTQTIQITAITRANLHTLSRVCQKLGITSKLIMPASFAVKGFVSIDPSLFILGTPDDIWVTSHYIGVEHATAVGDTSTDKLVQAVTEIKKQKPHLQHAYVCVDPTETETYTTALKDAIPTQVVEVKGIDAEADCPLMIKVLTVGSKDVVENKFPFPQFTLEANPDKAVTGSSETTSTPAIPVPPTPTVPSVKPVSATSPTVKSESVAAITPAIVAPSVSPITTPKAPLQTIDATAGIKPASGTQVEPVTPISSSQHASVKPKSSFMKYILLAGGVALIIGLIGGGIIVSQQATNTVKTDDTTAQASPTTETPPPSIEPTATPVASVSASPVAKANINILVLNATGVAGKAGQTASTFKTAGYTKVQTGNATEEYEDGTHIMIKDTKNTALADQIIKDTKLSLDKMTYSNKEDAKGTYDVIVVLAE